MKKITIPIDDPEMEDGYMPAANLFAEKVDNSCEMIIVLYEKCNYTCSFCPQDHDSTVGMSYDEIVAKAEPIVEYINKNIIATEFAIRILGGELFTDSAVAAGFLDAYRELRRRIVETADWRGRGYKFYWISNFSFITAREQIEEFIVEQGDTGTFVVSYDPAGRFTAPALATFKENVELFWDHINNFNTTMTKQNITRILEGDEYFSYLCDNHGYSIDMYVKSKDWEDWSVPRESQVLEFYKLLAERYRNIEIIQPFLRNKNDVGFNSTLCTRGNGFSMTPTGENVSEGCLGTHYLLKNDHSILRNFRNELNELKLGQNCFL